MVDMNDSKFGGWYDAYTGFPVITMVAEGAVAKYHLVQLGTAGRQVKSYDGDGGITEPAIGVALEAAATGLEIVILPLGPVIRMLTGTNGVTRGDWVVPDTTADEEGYVMTDDGTMGTNKSATIGLALEAGDAKGELVPVMMCGNGIFGVN